MSFSCSNCERQTKYSCITCGKSVCVRSECSIPEVNEEAIGWQPNKRVGYCLKCALCTEKLVKDCQSEVDDKDHGQRDLTTCIREEEEEEESDFIEEGEMVSSECGKRKKRIGRRATWKEDHITDMVNIIVNDDQLVKKLIFCNTKKASNTEAYEMLRKRLNVEYNKTTGSDFPFQVQQMRNKFKSCISTCKQICMTMKTASGIERFVEERGYGKWFDLLYVLVKTRDSCQRENACEPSVHIGNVDKQDTSKNDQEVDGDDDDCASTSSSLMDSSGEVPSKGKRFLAKKPASKRAKTEQMAKAVELLQSTIENDPTKELLQILREDMKQSREQEMRYFQLMCGLLTPNSNPNMQPHGNFHPYSSSYSDDFHHQSHNFAQQSVSNPRASSSHPSTPSFGYTPLMSSAPKNDEQSLLHHVQSTMTSQGQSGVSQLYQF